MRGHSERSSGRKRGAGRGHEMQKEAEVRPGHAARGAGPHAQILGGGTLSVSFPPFFLLEILSVGRKPASLSESWKVAPANEAPATGVPEHKHTAVNP